jgi:hypothetical protein
MKKRPAVAKTMAGKEGVKRNLMVNVLVEKMAQKRGKSKLIFIFCHVENICLSCCVRTPKTHLDKCRISRESRSGLIWPTRSFAARQRVIVAGRETNGPSRF